MDNKQIRRLWHKSVRSQIELYKNILIAHSIGILTDEIMNTCYLCDTATYIKLGLRGGGGIINTEGRCSVCLWQVYESTTCLDWLDKYSNKLYKDAWAYSELRGRAIGGDVEAIAIIQTRIKMLEEWDKRIDSTDFISVYSKLLKEK